MVFLGYINTHVDIHKDSNKLTL